MKKIILFVVLCMTTLCTYGQIEKEYIDSIQKTKYTKFISKRSTKTKFTTSNSKKMNLDSFRLNTTLHTYFKKYFNQDGGENTYFLILYGLGSSANSIEYSDLVILNKAIEGLMEECEIDKESKGYIENKYTTDEGIVVGYYIRGHSEQWFLRLKQYEECTNISKIDKFYTLLLTWQTAIEEDMANNLKK